MTRCFCQHPAHWQCVKHLGSCRWSYIDGEWWGLIFYNQNTDVWTFTKDPTLMKHHQSHGWGNTRQSFPNMGSFQARWIIYIYIYIDNIYVYCLSMYDIIVYRGHHPEPDLVTCDLLSKCSPFTGFRPHTGGKRFLGKNSGHAETASILPKVFFIHNVWRLVPE